jgi:hypothetical protein
MRVTEPYFTALPNTMTAPAAQTSSLSTTSTATRRLAKSTSHSVVPALSTTRRLCYLARLSGGHRFQEWPHDDSDGDHAQRLGPVDGPYETELRLQ